MIILQFLSEHGLDTLLIALATVVLTGLIKMPVKYLASKSSKSSKITRFITFLPIIIGFGFTVLLMYFMEKKVTFNRAFFAQWLSAVSLSLAIYAFWEKFVPSEKKILSEAEIEANKTVVAELKNKLVDTVNADETTNVKGTDTQSVEPTKVGQAIKSKKIILTNKK